MQERPGIVLAADIGGSNTSLLAVDAWSREEIARDRFVTPPMPTPEHMMDVLDQHLHAMLRGRRRGVDEVLAVGCSVAGQVDDLGRVLNGGSLGWMDVGLRDLVALRFSDASAFVEQDAKAGALGEAWLGCAIGRRSFVFLALGTGAGAGIVAECRLVRGAHHAAGELGDLVTRRDGSTIRLADRIGGRVVRGRARELAGEELSASEVLLRAEDDPRLRPLAEEVFEHVAAAAIAIGALLDPEAIIFGGGTARAGAALVDRVRPRLRGALSRPPELLLSALGEDAQLYGAMYGALEELGAELVRPRVSAGGEIVAARDAHGG